MIKLDAKTPAGAAFWVGIAFFLVAWTLESTDFQLLTYGLGVLSLLFSLAMARADRASRSGKDADELLDEDEK